MQDNRLDNISLNSEIRDYEREYDREDASVTSKSVLSHASGSKLYALEEKNRRALNLLEHTPPGWMGGVSSAYIERVPRPRDDEEGEEGRPNKKKKKKPETSTKVKKSVTFDDVEHELKTQTQASSMLEFTDPGCWGCRHGVLTLASLDTGIPGFQILADFVLHHLYKVSLDEFFITVKNIFDDELKFQVAAKEGVSPPEDWSLESIKKHFRSCICDPAIHMRIKIHDLRTIYEVTRKNVFYKVYDEDTEDEEGRLQVSDENLNALIKVGNTLDSSYSINTEKSAAYTNGITPTHEKKKESLRRIKQL